MIDLTKEIEVEAIFEYNGDGMYEVSFRFKGMDVTEEEGRDYRRLLEAAPRMLAFLKKFGDPNAVFLGTLKNNYGIQYSDVIGEEVKILLAEIEGGE